MPQEFPIGEENTCKYILFILLETRFPMNPFELRGGCLFAWRTEVIYFVLRKFSGKYLIYYIHK